MDEWEHGRLMDIVETDLPWAYKQGWSIVFRWRDNPRGPHGVDPSQSSRDIGED